MINQPRADRILPDIFPFFSIAFAVAQKVIEKAGLPMWRGCGNGGRERSFQKSDGCSHSSVGSYADKAMDMIGHDDISPEGNPLCFCLFREGDEFLINRVGCKDSFALECVECNEVDRGVV